MCVDAIRAIDVPSVFVGPILFELYFSIVMLLDQTPRLLKSVVVRQSHLDNAKAHRQLFSSDYL